MREKGLFGERLEMPTSEKSKSKKVSFSVTDDVAYIYPWSPTKFLLFGKLTEDQLKRRKSENAENITPILKKNTEHNENMKYTLQELKTTNQKPAKRPRDSLAFIIANVFSEGDAPKNLEEIQVDENLTNQKHPLLPMAIFSPSDHKDLVTNSPYCEHVAPPVLKPINQNHYARKPMAKNFSGLGEGLRGKEDQLSNSLPHLPNAKVNDSIFGCIRDKTDNLLGRPPKYLRMPSIDCSDSLSGTSPRAKPLIRAQISQRYAIDEADLENIKHLNEEDFTTLESSNLKHHRRPLPLLADYTNKIMTPNNKNHINPEKQKNKVRSNNNIKKKSKTPISKLNRIVGSNRRAKSCKSEAKPFSPRNTPSIVQLCISPKDISSGCCK